MIYISRNPIDISANFVHMNYILKILLVLIIILFNEENSFAQFISAQVGISGMTCPACTRSVEKNLRKLDFISDVKMNLKEANGKILFKEGKSVSIEKVARAVENAGYSVNNLNAVFHFQQLEVSDNFCYTSSSALFQFVKVGNRTLSGDTELKVVGKSFMDHKAYKTWEKLLIPMCISLSQKVVFVTI